MMAQIEEVLNSDAGSLMAELAIAKLARPPAWRRRRDQRHPEILTAAREVIEEGGYEGAFLARVARRASVSEATLYKYFAGKQDLVSQVIGAWMGENLDRLEVELAAIDTIRAQLQLLAASHLYTMRAAPGLHRLIYSVFRWSPDYLGSTLHSLNQRYARRVETAFNDAIARGELSRDIDGRLARDMFFGGLEHVGWRMVYDVRSLDIDKATGALVRQIITGLAAGQADVSAVPLVSRLEKAVAGLEAHLSTLDLD